MKRIRIRFFALACVVLISACQPVATWQSNGTGSASGRPVLREATILQGQARIDAQNPVTSAIGLVIPDDAAIESIETVDMQWAEGGYEVKGATVIRMSFPRSEAEAFGRTTPCRILPFNEWRADSTYATYNWMFDLVNEPVVGDAHVCDEPVPGQPPGPTRNMIAIISNSDPVNVVVATYPTPSD